MLKVLHEQGDEQVRVFVAETPDGHRFEFVDATEPPLPRSDKWVLGVSTLVGCPARCLVCDAGGGYEGRLSAAEILAQIEHLVRRRYPSGPVPVKHLEVQFTRMGEPAFNPGVLEALIALPKRLDAPGLVPLVSTVAPASTKAWFADLLLIKRRLYGGGRFLMQFSVHSTDEQARRRLVPVRCFSFAEMAAFGRNLFEPGDRKVILSIAAARGEPLDPAVLRAHFDPARFLVKLTPIFATEAARRSGLVSLLDPGDPVAAQGLARSFEAVGFETQVALGDAHERELGASCGMVVLPARAGGPRARRG